MIDPAGEVRKAISESELLRGLEEAKALLGGGRKLKPDEVKRLNASNEAAREASREELSDVFPKRMEL